MISNRQSSRRRGRGGSQRSTGGSGQRDTGNRIDSRARGNAAQLLEKYKNMARDAQMQGDRVNTEYYLQFADHYFRVLSDGRSRSEDQRAQPHSNGIDGDHEEYGDEGEPIRGAEQSQGRENGNGGDSRYSEARRDDARRDDGRRREYGQRDDSRRDGPNRDYQGRDDQNRDSGRREQNPDPNRRDYGSPGNDRDDQGGQQSPQTSRPPYNGDAVDDRVETRAEPAGRRSSRGRRPVADAPLEVTPSFDADRLPPSLGVAPADTGDSPKRRRGRPPAGDATQAS